MKGSNRESVENFKKIQQAYEVLSDKEQRERYDNPPQQHPNINHMFNEMMKNMFHPNSSHNQNINQEIVIDISLTDIVKGFQKNIHIQRRVFCRNGNGGICPQCRGMGFFCPIPIVRIPCNICVGKGFIFCSCCPNEEKIELQVNKNCNDTFEDFVFENKGNEYENGKFGNIIIKFNIQKEQNGFFYENGDLIYKIKITLGESLCGFEKKIKLLNDKNIIIKTQGKIHTSGDMISFNKFGINESKKLIIFIEKVEYPENIHWEKLNTPIETIKSVIDNII